MEVTQINGHTKITKAIGENWGPNNLKKNKNKQKHNNNETNGMLKG